jgi:hypothetical protein
LVVPFLNNWGIVVGGGKLDLGVDCEIRWGYIVTFLFEYSLRLFISSASIISKFSSASNHEPTDKYNIVNIVLTGKFYARMYME